MKRPSKTQPGQASQVNRVPSTAPSWSASSHPFQYLRNHLHLHAKGWTCVFSLAGAQVGLPSLTERCLTVELSMWQRWRSVLGLGQHLSLIQPIWLRANESWIQSQRRRTFLWGLSTQAAQAKTFSERQERKLPLHPQLQIRPGFQCLPSWKIMNLSWTRWSLMILLFLLQQTLIQKMKGEIWKFLSDPPALPDSQHPDFWPEVLRAAAVPKLPKMPNLRLQFRLASKKMYTFTPVILPQLLEKEIFAETLQSVMNDATRFPIHSWSWSNMVFVRCLNASLVERGHSQSQTQPTTRYWTGQWQWDSGH